MANDDNELSEYLVGTWTEVQESPGLVVTLSHTHHKDGSWMLEASANYDGAATLKNSATGTWRVEDLRSTNGTFLGATRLTEPREVAVGSVLRIGQTVVELQR